MKRLSIFLIIMSIFFGSKGQIPKPDFAYPQTVLKNADADLEKALSQKDATKAINALLRIYIAKTRIDPAEEPACIALVEQTAEIFRGSDLDGVFCALQAKMYRNFLNHNYKALDRDLPLFPLPADLTEWSGAQLTHRIDSLVQESLKPENVQRLKSLSVKNYEWFVEYGKQAPVYYPTMLDFVLLRALDVTDNKEIVDKVYALALDEHKSGTTPYIIWKAEDIARCNLSDSGIKQLADLYGQYKGNIDCGFVLDRLGQAVAALSIYDHDSPKNLTIISLKRDFLDKAADFKKKFPKSPFVPNIDEYCDRIRQKSVNVNYPGYIYPGETMRIIVNSLNVNDCAVELYKVSNKENDSYINIRDFRSFLRNNKPVARVACSFAGTLPFKNRDTVEIKVPAAGYYIAVPSFAGQTIEKSYYGRCVRSCPVMPIGFSQCQNPKIAVVNSLTGAPVANATVTLTKRDNDNKNITAKTDTDGVADFSEIPQWAHYEKLTVITDGDSYVFNGPYPYKNDGKITPSETVRASVLTDRDLYHRGEKVNFLAVFYNSETTAKGIINNVTAKGLEVTVTVSDANYQPVDTIKGVTDEFGRFYGETILPEKGLSGAFVLKAETGGNFAGSTSINVSDYKLPDSEIVDAVAERNVPGEGDVTVSGMLRTYSGVPMAGAEVTLTLQGSTFFRSFFNHPGNKISSATVQTDADGKFIHVFPASTFKPETKNSDIPVPMEDTVWDEEEVADDYSQYDFYTVTIDAVTPSGTTAKDAVFFTVGKQYMIEFNVSNSNIDGTKPFIPNVSVVNAAGDTVDLPLRWTLTHDKDTVVASGEYSGKLDLSGITPGEYTLEFATTDESLANPVKQQIVIYNATTDIVPGNSPLWMPVNRVTITADGKISLLYGATTDLDVYTVKLVDSEIRHVKLSRVTKGYHTLTMDIDPGAVNTNIYLAGVHNYGLFEKEINIDPAPAPMLKIESESFRDRLTPTQEETWKIKVLDADGKPVEAALALDMYNKALDALTYHNFNIYAANYYRTWMPFRIDGLYVGSASFNSTSRYSHRNMFAPEIFERFRYLSSGYRVYSRDYSSRRFMMKASASGAVYEETFDCAALPEPCADMAMNETMECCDDAESEEAVMVKGAGPLPTGNAEEVPTEADMDVYRDSEVTLGIWAPALATDADGNVVYTFTVPNANTTWKLLATAWTRELVSGRISREFVASKPLMVMPNNPRFMRAGDVAVFRATVLNATDAEIKAATVLEVFNPLSGAVIKSKRFEGEIAANGNATYDIEYTATSDVAAVGYRVKSSATTPEGRFTDGEQTLIPVHDNLAQLIETSPFYLNLGDTEYTQKLPKQKDARLTLTFCENPAWTIVTALPGLRKMQKYANSAAAAIFSAAVAKGITDANPEIGKAIEIWRTNPEDSALISMLEKNEDLKIAALNCTPWVQAANSDTERMANLALVFGSEQVAKAIAEAIEVLGDLQRSDGGWAWGDWCEESSLWVTGNVLSMMAELKSFGWMPDNIELKNMITKAVKYYDRTTEKEIKKDADRFDMLYCLFRPFFNDIKNVSNGEKTINATIKRIGDDWKSYNDPAYKSMAAEALWLNGRQKDALKIMESVSQFGVYTKSQGLRFPSVNALYDYAIILEAFARILPDSKEVDGLRQQLIVRKQATDWGDAVVTTEVVSSILSSGSKWTVDAKGAKVTVDGKEVKPANRIETATGSLRADLSKYRGKELVVKTTGATPSYGAVYAQFSEKISDVSASGVDDLDIAKSLYVRRGTDWEYVTADTHLAVGDRVKVQLTIHSKRNMHYVTIRDERPAAFEPVDQLPGWIWSEGVAFYRENNDDNTGMNVIYMRPGTYLLTYEMNVNTAGTYLSGVATIQSQYEPSLTAHSAGNVLRIKLKD